MRFVRAGSAKAFPFRKRVLPAVLLTALLAPACARILRGQPQSASVPAGASGLVVGVHDSGAGPEAQPGTQPGSAGGPNQEIGELFEMATALKAEVAKTNQDMLSVSVVRKAASIEQLAHKMRMSGGGR